jgi:hypothetical protein
LTEIDRDYETMRLDLQTVSQRPRCSIHHACHIDNILSIPTGMPLEE